MMNKRPLAAAILAATLTSPAMADEIRDTLSLTPFAGYQYFDDKRDLDESATVGFGIEYRFLPNWAVEAVYSRADADRKDASGSSDFDEIRVDGTYYFAGPEAALNPYLSAGVGHADFGVEDTVAGYSSAGTDHDETRVNIGGGVRYHLNDQVSLRGDLREFHGPEKSTFDTQVSLGLSLAFHRTTHTPEPAPVPVDSDGDGIIDANDQCPGTLPNVAVNAMGCEPDSDNDGVIDRKDQCPDSAQGAEVDAKGCEGVTETVQTIELQVKFATGSAQIRDGYDAEIRAVAEFMRENPQTSVEIAGHTDSTGPAAFNKSLSQERASAVAERLISAHGIDRDRVSAMGYGEEQPVASNDTAAGRADNRRVEARVQVAR